MILPESFLVVSLTDRRVSSVIARSTSLSKRSLRRKRSACSGKNAITAIDIDKHGRVSIWWWAHTLQPHSVDQ